MPSGTGAASYSYRIMPPPPPPLRVCLYAREWGAERCRSVALAPGLDEGFVVIMPGGTSPASSSSGRGVSGRSCSSLACRWGRCRGGGGCGLLRDAEKMSMCGMCTGIASGRRRSACSGLSRSGRRWSAVLFPDEGGEPPGDWQGLSFIGR